MGSGSWTSSSYASYTTSKGMTYDSLRGVITSNFSNQENFKSTCLPECLNPKGVIRECRDSDEHPNTVPVILGLDVTGSMGQGAVEVAKKLNVIMTDIYEHVKDVEFMVMGIGDMSCDRAPIQASQFESDIRIAEQLDQIYFEFGGGGNGYESYTAAWYFGLKHTDLDCWKRGKKGIIITIGDEPLNPYLPVNSIKCRWLGLNDVCGDTNESDIETKDLYKIATEKFHIYHLSVNDPHTNYKYQQEWHDVDSSWKKYLDKDHYKVVTMDDLASTISNIVTKAEQNTENVTAEGISW